MRVELGLDEVPTVLDIRDVDAEVLRDAIKLVLAEILEVIPNQGDCERVLDALSSEVLELEDHAFANIPSADSRRLEVLQSLDDLLYLLGRCIELLADLVR